MTPFDRLYLKHHRAVRSAVGSILAGAEDREDAMQEAWTRLYTHLGAGGEVTRAWLVEVARNEARDIRRKVKIRIADELPEAERIVGARACQAARIDGTVERVRDAIAALPEELRIILQANVTGVSQKAIATRLGIDQATVSRKIEKAKKKVSDWCMKQPR